MQIRELQPDFDRFEALLRLIMAAFAFMDGRIDPPSSAHRLTVKGLREKARQEHGLIAVGEGEGQPLLGCLFCLPEASGLLYLGKLAVAPYVQGRGIGRALVEAAARHAAAEGLKGLRLQTRIELGENHRAFAAMGFVKTAEGRHPGFDRTTWIEMQRPV